jgi:hypothetical protein
VLSGAAVVAGTVVGTVVVGSVGSGTSVERGSVDDVDEALCDEGGAVVVVVGPADCADARHMVALVSATATSTTTPNGRRQHIKNRFGLG